MNPTADLHAPNLSGKQYGELARLRREADLSQRALADLIGASRHVIRRMEKGEIPANTDVLERLAELYGHEIGDLVAAARFDRHAYLERVEAERMEGQIRRHDEEHPQP